MKKFLGFVLLSVVFTGTGLSADEFTEDTTDDSAGKAKQEYKIDKEFQKVSPERFYNFMSDKKVNYEKRRLRSFGRLDRSINFDLLKSLDNDSNLGEEKEDASLNYTDILPGQIPKSQFRVQNNPVRPTYSNVRELSNINNRVIKESEERETVLQYRARTVGVPENIPAKKVTPESVKQAKNYRSSLSSRENLVRKNYEILAPTRSTDETLDSQSETSVDENWQDSARFWKKMKSGTQIKKY